MDRCPAEPCGIRSGHSVPIPAAPPGNARRGCYYAICGISFVKRRIGEVDVFLIHLVFCQPYRLAKPLEVHDLPLAQEADDIVHIRVIGEAKDVVIGDPCLLFCCNDVRATFLESVIFIVQTAFK